jgi:hypothetical protein
VMANGVRVGPLPLRIPSTTALAREWQGIADLLPRYPAVHDRRPEGIPHGQTRRWRPHELPLPWLTSTATKAHEMHAAIEAGWATLPTPPAVFPRIGFGHGTLRACLWDGTRIRVTTAMPDGDDAGGWAHDLGDGTVPAYCGLPVEMDNYPREHLRVHRRHGPIAELNEIEAILDALDSDAPAAPFRVADEGDIGLGLDVEDLHLAGAEIPITVRAVSPKGSPASAARATVWATASPVVSPPDSGTAKRPDPVRLEWDDQADAFRGTLPAQLPGLVEITVQAQALSNVPGTQTVEVLDDDGLE